MNIPIEDVLSVSDTRREALKKFGNATDLMMARLRRLCTQDGVKEIHLQNGEIEAEVHFLPKDKYIISFKLVMFFPDEGSICSPITENRKSLKSMLVFAGMLTPNIFDGIIRDLNSQTHRLNAATKLVSNLS